MLQCSERQAAEQQQQQLMLGCISLILMLSLRCQLLVRLVVNILSETPARRMHSS